MKLFLIRCLFFVIICSCSGATPGISVAESPGKDQSVPPVPVEVSRVERLEIASGQPFVGTVYPRRISDVGSAVDGRVVSLPLEEGQAVKAGDAIAELLRGLLEIEREGAVAELERLRQVLAELRAGSRPEQIEQARAAVEGLEAKLAYTKGRFARLQKLADRGTSTADELQDAQAELRQVEAQLAGSRAELALTIAGPRAEQIAQAAAAAAVQEAAVERIDDQLAKHTIRSPFNGWVVQRFTEQGQWVVRGGLVARVAELNTVEVEVQVPELTIGSLQPGMDVRLDFDAAPGQAWIGTVERIVPQADLLSRSFPVKVVLENRVVDGQPVLRGGLLARAWLPVGRRGVANVVPKDALVLGGPSPVVYAVTADREASAAGGPGQLAGTARAVEVSLGATVSGNVEVIGGLSPGEYVVIRGNERLRPGIKVAFEPPVK